MKDAEYCVSHNNHWETNVKAVTCQEDGYKVEVWAAKLTGSTVLWDINKISVFKIIYPIGLIVAIRLELT